MIRQILLTGVYNNAIILLNKYKIGVILRIYGGIIMKKWFLRIVSLAVSLALVVSVAGMQIFAAKTGLNKTSIKMVPGTSYTLKLTGVSGKVSWSSSDKKIASVSSSGKVTAVSAGKAVITAKSGGKSYKCTVKVLAGSIKLKSSSVSVAPGGSKTVSVTVKGTKKVKCVSLDKSIVTVSTGTMKGNSFTFKVTGKKTGSAYVKVYLKEDKSISKLIKVTVTSGGRNSEKVPGAEDKYTDDSKSQNTSDASDKNKESSETDNISSMSYAEQVLYYVNIERENAGVKPLVLDDKLCKAAEIRADELLELFDHTRPDGTSCFSVFEEVGFEGFMGGENIAAGRSSAKDTVSDWMSSPGHRANILDPSYTVMGAARSYSAYADYRYYWAQLFG